MYFYMFIEGILNEFWLLLILQGRGRPNEGENYVSADEKGDVRHRDLQTF